jgi:ubiquinol-cytochrome c reductase iron-sulfur subunit
VNRRSLIQRSLSAITGLGAYLVAVPFVKSLLPSAKAQALGNPIEIDVSGIPLGETRPYLYRGATVLVTRRTPEMLVTLTDMDGRVLDKNTDPEFADPPYVDNHHRALRPEYLVVQGVCTHLGCVPIRTGTEGKPVVGDWWQGGFICPCHQSGYDYAGRVVRGPAPRNLPVPRHRYTGTGRLIVGEDPIAT